MFEYMHMNMTFFHGFGMLIFWTIIIFLFVSIFSTNSNNSNKESGLDILKKRLAKGEITQEQYESIKKTIQ